MRTLFIAAASALFFGALVTELSTRLWPGNYFALLVLSAVALFCSGLLNLRLVRPAAPAAIAPAFAGSEVTRPRAAAPRQSSGERRPAANESRNQGSRDQGTAPARDQSHGERSRSPRTETEPGQRAEPARAQNPEPPAGPRAQGTVKWFNRTKGFGFIIRESGDEVFVHQRSIRATGEGDDRRRPALQDGQAVSFYVAVRDKGPQAEDVVPVESQ